MPRDGKALFDDGFKVCKSCQQRLPVDQFYRHSDARLKRGYTLDPRCIPCVKEAKKKLRFGGDRHAAIKGYERGSAKDRALGDPRARRRLFDHQLDYQIEQQLLEDWARNGFTSGYAVLATRPAHT